jgi:hypothetical protein
MRVTTSVMQTDVDNKMVNRKKYKNNKNVQHLNIMAPSCKPQIADKF